MQPLPEPTTEHREFDELCQGIEEFEPLPNWFGEIVARRNVREEQEGTLDPLILAGLVSPV
jgi:hypothetical protein